MGDVLRSSVTVGRVRTGTLTGGGGVGMGVVATGSATGVAEDSGDEDGGALGAADEQAAARTTNAASAPTRFIWLEV